MKKRLTKMVLLVLALSLMLSTVVLAETQSGTVKKHGVDVTYKLACTFKLNSNDTATATTSWSGKSGYKVKVILYQCQNAFASYQKIGSSLDAKSAKVTGSVKGVWKFKSKHYEYKNSSKSTVKLCEFTDW